MVGSIVAPTTTKTMSTIKSQEAKGQPNSQRKRKLKVSAQVARRARMFQKLLRMNPTRRYRTRAIGLEEIIFAMCARLTSKMSRRSSTHVIANIRYAIGVTIIKCKPRRGSVPTVASITRWAGSRSTSRAGWRQTARRRLEWSQSKRYRSQRIKVTRVLLRSRSTSGSNPRQQSDESRRLRK